MAVILPFTPSGLYFVTTRKPNGNFETLTSKVQSEIVGMAETFTKQNPDWKIEVGVVSKPKEQI